MSQDKISIPQEGEEGRIHDTSKVREMAEAGEHTRSLYHDRGQEYPSSADPDPTSDLELQRGDVYDVAQEARKMSKREFEKEMEKVKQGIDQAEGLMKDITFDLGRLVLKGEAVSGNAEYDALIANYDTVKKRHRKLTIRLSGLTHAESEGIVDKDEG